MIGVEEAKQRMMEQAAVLPSERVPLLAALDRYTASDVIAPCDHPLFDMSAVDGYALHFDGSAGPWRVVASIAAGAVMERPLAEGECARIFTGADTVVMQEFVERDGDRITHTDAGLKAGGNVRKQGEHVRTGAMVLARGSHLGPEALGLLATLGLGEAEVTRRPRIGVVVTGGEFSDEPTPGRIFSSNDVMLEAALTQTGCATAVVRAPDDRDQLARTITERSKNVDVVISTGGASVGEHDLVEETVRALGGTIHFHGVAQKPGKPMLFAMVEGKPFFGLPGNPRAVMVLFREYVLPFLRSMQGASEPWPRTERLPLSHPLTVKGERAEFRAARVMDGRVTLLADEGSHMLTTLTQADALAFIPASARRLTAGDPVEVHYLHR